MKKQFAILLALFVSLGLFSNTQAQGFYDGETVELVVPFRNGGGTDRWARAVAPFLQKYLDGATIQVINEPGGGSISSANSFAQRRAHDGMSLLVSSGSTVLPYLLNNDAVQYEFNDFQAIAGSPVGGIVYTSPDTGITSGADLCDNEELLIYGGISTTGLDMVPLLSYELLNANVFEILGYDGKGPVTVAFQQGEVNLDYQTSSSYLKNIAPLVEEGKATPLYTFGVIDGEGNLVRDPAFSEMPTIKEVYEECYGEAPSGVAWDAFKAATAAGFAIQKIIWAHGDAPAGANEALIAAATEMIADPEFQEVKSNLIGDYDFSTGEATMAQFGAAGSISDEAFAWLTDFLASK